VFRICVKEVAELLVDSREGVTVRFTARSKGPKNWRKRWRRFEDPLKRSIPYLTTIKPALGGRANFDRELTS
jgi:hypothetical protein